MLGICHKKRETRLPRSKRVVAFFSLFPQIGAKVLLISPEEIKLESCAFSQIKTLEEGNWWLYPDDAGDLSERGRNAANLINDGEGLFCPLFSNWCHGSAYIS